MVGDKQQPGVRVLRSPIAGRKSEGRELFVDDALVRAHLSVADDRSQGFHNNAQRLQRGGVRDVVRRANLLHAHHTHGAQWEGGRDAFRISLPRSYAVNTRLIPVPRIQ